MHDNFASQAREGVRTTRLLVFIPPLAVLASIRAFAVNVPYWDEWDLVPFVIGLQDGTLTFGDFWMQNNEHRIAAVKLIMTPLILLTDFDVTAHMYAGFALQFLAFIFLWLVLDLTLCGSQQPLVIPLGLVIGLLMFSPAQEEIWLMGQASLQWHLCNLTAAASVWVFTRWPRQWFTLPIAFFLTCAGMLAIASGIMLWGMVLVAIVTQSLTLGTRLQLNWLLAWAFAAFVLFAGYFSGFHTTVVAPNVFFFVTDPLNFVGFVLVYLGWSLGQGGGLWAAGVIGFAGLIALAAGAYFAFQSPSSRVRNILPWVWLSVYALFVALATAVGRVESGLVMATATRYTAGSLLFWVGLAVIMAVALREFASERQRMKKALQLSGVALWTAGCVNYARLYQNGYRAFVKSEKDRTLGLAEVYQYGAPHDGALTFLYPNAERVRDYARRLEARGLGPFSERMIEERRRLANVVTVAKKVISGEGVLDVAQCGLIAGWAWDREQPEVPVRVHIYDDEVLLVTLVANQFRLDLANAGLGNGSHGFSYAPPAQLRDGRAHSIRAQISGTDADLKGPAQPLVCK